jgi:hypothetical protein
MDIKKEIEPIMGAILFVVFLCILIDVIYPMLKAWLF